MVARTETLEAIYGRIPADRRELQPTTGRRTPSEKTRNRFDALKHGRPATSPVLPGESAEEWQLHVQAFKDDLKPRSVLEDCLADRIAHLAWQIKRDDRYLAAVRKHLAVQGQLDLEALDDRPEIRRARRLQLATEQVLREAIATYHKVRRNLTPPDDGESPAAG